MGKTVLIVDDDEDMLALVSRWFSKGGYEVETAVNGRDALDKIKNNKPDIILLDYLMPEMDGPATLAAIRADDAIKDIPVIFRTGMEDIESYNDSDDVRPDAIVPKSGGKPEIIKAVEDLL